MDWERNYEIQRENDAVGEELEEEDDATS